MELVKTLLDIFVSFSLRVAAETLLCLPLAIFWQISSKWLFSQDELCLDTYCYLGIGNLITIQFYCSIIFVLLYKKPSQSNIAEDFLPFAEGWISIGCNMYFEFILGGFLHRSLWHFVQSHFTLLFQKDPPQPLQMTHDHSKVIIFFILFNVVNSFIFVKCVSLQFVQRWFSCPYFLSLAIKFKFVNIDTENIFFNRIKHGDVEFLKKYISTAILTFDTLEVFKAIDDKKNSIYHLAAQVNEETIQAVTVIGIWRSVHELINSENDQGHTPLSLARLANKEDCIKALIDAGANEIQKNGGFVETENIVQLTRFIGIVKEFRFQLSIKDLQYGNTIFHVAPNRELVNALAELGCALDVRNSFGMTPLHAAVVTNRLDCVVSLLSWRADPNTVDSSSNTPLHLAVETANLSIVKALILFGTNVNKVNNRRKSSRHLAANQPLDQNGLAILNALQFVGAKRCSRNVHLFHGCTNGCRYNGKDDEQSITDSIAGSRHILDFQPESTKGERVLCLDGGGVRGLVLIEMLEAVEKNLGQSLIQYFDWIAGTSTGGIIALALACGKSVQECKSMYFRFKDEVFKGKAPYDVVPLERFLKKEFGDRTMADITGTKVLISTVAANTLPAELHFFRNYESNNNQSKTPGEQMVWQAARATAAAPSYFKPSECYLDGALIANNPTVNALTEIHNYKKSINKSFQKKNEKLVVSLGTGYISSTSAETPFLFIPRNLMSIKSSVKGLVGFQKLVANQLTKTDGEVVEQAKVLCEKMDCSYFRLSPSFSNDIELDETSDEQLITMLWETKVFIQRYSADFQRIAELLKI